MQDESALLIEELVLILGLTPASVHSHDVTNTACRVACSRLSDSGDESKRPCLSPRLPLHGCSLFRFDPTNRELGTGYLQSSYLTYQSYRRLHLSMNTSHKNMT